MNDLSSLTDEAVLKDLAQRLSRHRIHRNLTQAQLAYEAGVSKRTVERLEAGHSTQLSSFVRILRVLDLLPVLDQLITDTPTSPMAQLRIQQKTRRRASSRRSQKNSDQKNSDRHSKDKNPDKNPDRHSKNNPDSYSESTRDQPSKTADKKKKTGKNTDQDRGKWRWGDDQ